MEAGGDIVDWSSPESMVGLMGAEGEELQQQEQQEKPGSSAIKEHLESHKTLLRQRGEGLVEEELFGSLQTARQLQFQQQEKEQQQLPRIPALSALCLAGCLVELTAVRQLLACSFGNLQKLALPSQGGLARVPPAFSGSMAEYYELRVLQQEQQHHGGEQLVHMGQHEQQQQGQQEPVWCWQGTLGVQQLQELAVPWNILQDLELDVSLLLHMFAVHHSGAVTSSISTQAAAAGGAAEALSSSSREARETVPSFLPHPPQQEGSMRQLPARAPIPPFPAEAAAVSEGSGGVQGSQGLIKHVECVRQAELRLSNVRRLVVRVTRPTLRWLQQQQGHATVLVGQLLEVLVTLPSLREVSLMGPPPPEKQEGQLYRQQLQQQQQQQMQEQQVQMQQQLLPQAQQILAPVFAAVPEVNGRAEFFAHRGPYQHQQMLDDVPALSAMQAWSALEEEVAKQLSRLPHCRVSVEGSWARKWG
jgi:hypothetical protein